MNKVSFKFATGRVYGATQWIVGIYEMYSPDEYGFCDCRVVFGDDVRSIYGACVFPVYQDTSAQNITRAILEQYDAGRYETIQYEEYIANIE